MDSNSDVIITRLMVMTCVSAVRVDTVCTVDQAGGVTLLKLLR